MRTTLDTLLGGNLPADLLTTLTGGKLHVTSATARRIIDEGGAALRTVIVDDTGSVVGVGRRTRVAPGWVRDASLALSATCEGPACDVAARLCDLDHAAPWNPRHGHQRGATDIANLGRLCATQNHRKERDGWTATGTADGQRHWYHCRSGLTARHLPDHWQPSGLPHRDAPLSSGDPPEPRPGGGGSPQASEAPPDDPTVAELIDPPDPDVPF